MRVRIMVVAEIEVEEGKPPGDEARRVFDAFRKSVLPNDYGITLYTAGPNDLWQAYQQTHSYRILATEEEVT